MAVLAASLYLLPVLCLLAARADRARPLWKLALDIPFAVSLDVLFVLACARFVPLETAALASRPLAVAAAGAYLWWRKRRGEGFGWPRALRLGTVAIVLVVAGAAVVASLVLSRKYHIWDRFWHVSLVSSLRTQRVPFQNVYEPGHGLAYHYAGDAIAAMLQSFSLGSLHASHALSLAHDVLFGLTGATLALLFAPGPMPLLSPVTRTLRTLEGMLGAVLAAVCVLWAGPVTLWPSGGKSYSGYNFVNFYTLSFRPHVVLAGLLLTGIVAALFVRLRERASPDGGAAGRAPLPFAATGLPLLACTATLSISDEASTALLGLGLGAAWLVDPQALAPESIGVASAWLRRRVGGLGRALGSALDRPFVRRRSIGALLLLGLLVALVGANLLYAGLLSPGAARPGMQLVDWRSPGFGGNAPPLPWSAPNGLRFFISDTLALLVFCVAAIWAAVRARSRAVAASAVFVLVIVGAGLFGLARMDLAPRHSESHRFMTAPLLASPLMALLWLGWRTSRRMPGRSPVLLALVAPALALPAASTLLWLLTPRETPFATQASFGTREDFYATDCRSAVGGGLGLTAEPLYLSQPIFYTYSGCRPAFMPGSGRGKHKVKTSTPLQGRAALAELDRDMVGPEAPLGAICAARSGDAICKRAEAAGPCTPLGALRDGTPVARCSLDPAARAELLGRARAVRDEPATPPPESEEPERGRPAPNLDDGP